MPEWKGSSKATSLGWSRFMMTLPALSLLSMTTCCPKASVKPRTVIVQSSEIKKIDNQTYQVTKGWLVNRMRVEAGLKAALDRCTLEKD